MHLIFQPRTRWIAERIALAVIMGLEKVLHRDFRRVAETPHPPHLLMHQFGEGLGRLKRDRLQNMRTEIFALILPFLGEFAHAIRDRRRHEP